MLLKFNKVSRKSKMAMVADLMRMEIVYRHGGFYMDTNYHIFKNHTFDNWLTFKAVMPAQMIPNYKFSRDNGFFGCMKGFANI
jgi:mannosyltransferase OCH1-like enzyme